MNGVVSEQMTQHGIIYKQNYGVSVPRLREMAKQYPKNHDLARRLWSLKIRETMILATLLEPEDTFSFELAFEMLEDIDQIELVEQACMNLFCKSPDAVKICRVLVKSNRFWEQIAGFTLSARIAEKLNDKETKSIVSDAIEKSTIENLHLYKAIALSLSRLSRRGKETADFIMKVIEPLSYSNNVGQQYISHEVKEEISFLMHLF